MHYSEKRGIEIACRLSVCNVGGSGSHTLEILEPNCTDNYPNIFALRSPKAIRLLPGEHGELWGDYSVSQKNPPPEVFWHFFPNGWEFLVQILHAYYTFLSTLDYKFLFN